MRNANTNILVLLTAALLLSACSLLDRSGNPLDALREAIAETVVDEARAQAMLASLERSDQLMLQSAKALADGAEEQLALFVDYDSTPEAFQALYDKTSGARRKFQQDLLQEHINFKNMATAEEWASLAGVHSRAVNARAEALTRSALSAVKS
jgi:hypothetical protein